MSLPKFYTISASLEDKDQYVTTLKKCLSGNDGFVQIRLKNISTEVLASILESISSGLDNHPKLLSRILVNVSTYYQLRGILSTIKELRLGGVHFSGRCLSELSTLTLSEEYLELLNPTSLLIKACSCHDLNEINLANRFKLNFIVVSPVLPSKSCPSIRVLGWDGFQELAREFDGPSYALGGLEAFHYKIARENGGIGVAAINAFWNHQLYD